MMKISIYIAAALCLVLCVVTALWLMFSVPDVPVAGQAASGTASVSNQSVAGPAPQAANAQQARPVSAQKTLPVDRPQDSQVLQKAMNDIQLDRRLADFQAINIEGRNWVVLGTRSLVNVPGQPMVLVMRDEASGQLAYSQAGLRFVLRDGADYEGFIGERSNAKRLFVNSLYGEIAVDAALISAEYSALSKDARVTRLEFIPLATPFKPR